MQEKFDKELREIDKRLEQKEVKRSSSERVTSSQLFSKTKELQVPDLIIAPCSLRYICEYD